MRTFHAYTDESGNTGMRLFDTPPFFWTCTMITGADLDVVAGPQVHSWTQSLGVKELHANELGVGRIELLAEGLLALLEEAEARLVFTRVEKQHVARMKLVDTLLDSGLNKAVSNLHYGLRFHRLNLALAVAVNLSPKSVEEFWHVFAKEDAAGFREILHRLQWNVTHKIGDPRIRELLGDAIAWAIKYPEVLLTKSSYYDAPNIVAFALILRSMSDLVRDESGQVLRFVHDKQQQFEKPMRFVYEHMKGVTPTDSGGLSFMTDLERTKGFDIPLEIVSSGSSASLQLVDLILWLMMRDVDKDRVRAPKCSRLLQHCRDTGFLSEFSLGSHTQEVMLMRKEVIERPVTPEQLEKGRQLRETIEAARKQRMNEAPD